VGGGGGGEGKGKEGGEGEFTTRDREFFPGPSLSPSPGMWFVYLAKCLRMHILPNRRDKLFKQ
jgi:hypothetical protein